MSIVVILGLYLCTVNLNLSIMENKTIDRHLGNFNIAGFTYWEGCMTIADLKVGSQLQLVRERENRSSRCGNLFQRTQTRLYPSWRERTNQQADGFGLWKDFRLSYSAHITRRSPRETSGCSAVYQRSKQGDK